MDRPRRFFDGEGYGDYFSKEATTEYLVLDAGGYVQYVEQTIKKARERMKEMPVDEICGVVIGTPAIVRREVETIALVRVEEVQRKKAPKPQ